MNLKTLLEQIEIRTSELHQCLIEEHAALSNNHYDNLVTIAEQKKVLVDELNQLDQQRQQMAGSSDFMSFLQQTDPGQTLSKQWQQLSEKIRSCQQQNDINGRLLSRRSNITEEMLNLFTGRKTTEDTTYGPNGMTSPPGASLTKTQV